MNAIVHFPYPIPLNGESGSSLRPIRILEAFKQIFQITLVAGSMEDRKLSMEDVIKQIKSGKEYAFCYSESSTMPCNLAGGKKSYVKGYDLDFNFFRLLHTKGVPIGVFLRDAYWLYAGINDYTFFKRFVYLYEYKRDIRKYNSVCDMLFVPSARFARMISRRVRIPMMPLPPGLSGRQYKMRKQLSQRVGLIYVGGMGVFYDFQALLKGLSNMPQVDVTLVTRDEDWNVVKDKYSSYLDTGRIVRVSASGAILEKMYARADLALLFFAKNDYRDLAMPFKLFEYIDFEKPIITNEGTAAADFIKDNGLGWVLRDEQEVFACIKSIINDPKVLLEKIENLKKVKATNTWLNRATEAAKSLMKSKNA